MSMLLLSWMHNMIEAKFRADGSRRIEEEGPEIETALSGLPTH